MGVTDDWLGRAVILPETRGMTYSVRHTSCGRVHDAAKSEVVARYADCTRWKCPHCSVICDDRPLDWGGNIEKLDDEWRRL